MRHRLAALALSIAALPSAALAHVGGLGHSGFTHGFMHPLTGLDHTLAMFAIGLVAYQLGGRARWLVPLTFIVCTALGGGLALAGINLPVVEIGIAVSVVALGALAAFKVSPPLWAVLTAVGIFAFFHGHAHMTEMPLTASMLSYSAGFLAATTLLHGAGLGLGFAADRATRGHGAVLVRGVAGAISLAGVGFLVGAL